GFSLLTRSTAPYSALFFVALEPWDERKGKSLGAPGILATLNRRFYGIPGAQVVAFGPPAIQGLGSGSGFDMMLEDRGGTHTPQELEAPAAHSIDAAQK